jgi:hypothetical protein
MDTTPTDPVQRGCVDLQGLSNKTATDDNICNQRNMLDFNDITIDGKGHVLVAYSDGCVEKCVNDHTVNAHENSHSAVNMVMRQASGRGLLAKFDPKSPTGRTPGSSPGSGSGGGSGTGSGSGGLATTGSSPVIAGAALVLVLAALAIRRRRSGDES